MMTDGLKIEDRQEAYQLLQKHISTYMMTGKSRRLPV